MPSPSRLYWLTLGAAAALGLFCFFGALDLSGLDRTQAGLQAEYIGLWPSAAAAPGLARQFEETRRFMKRAWIDFVLLAGFGCGLVGAFTLLAVGERRQRFDLESREAENARLRDLVFDSVAEGIIITDAAGGRVVFNPSAERILGGPPQRGGTGVKGLYCADGRTPVPIDQMPLARAARGETVEAQDFCVKGKDERRVYVRMTARPLRDAQGRLSGGVTVFRDETERFEADQKIRRLSRDLGDKSSALSAATAEIEDFAQSVSHGLRAPLRAVDGFSRLLEAHLPPAKGEDRRLLSVIQVNTRRMGAVLDDLLAYVHLGRKDLEPSRVELEPLARAAFARFLAQSPKRKASLSVHELPAAWGDEAMIEQVLANLLDNALKFSAVRQESVVEVGAGDSDGQSVYYVRDNGVGFNPRYAHRLFGMFQRLHGPDEFEGTGVGLAIVARIVQRHGGRVWAESQEGRGACFYFTLPKARVS